MEKWSGIYVGITFLRNLGGPNSKECSLNLKPIFKLGFNLEFESEIHLGAIQTNP